MCDSCDKWFHASCERISLKTYHHLSNDNYKWESTQCALPRLDDSFFDEDPPPSGLNSSSSVTSDVNQSLISNVSAD